MAEFDVWFLRPNIHFVIIYLYVNFIASFIFRCSMNYTFCVRECFGDTLTTGLPP